MRKFDYQVNYVPSSGDELEAFGWLQEKYGEGKHIYNDNGTTKWTWNAVLDDIISFYFADQSHAVEFKLRFG